jgi:hypothetical protein
MKSLFISFVFFLLLIEIAGAQSIVRNKSTKRQMENMVFMRWGGFRPRWYYILFHNKYRKGPDRRTLLQLAPTNYFIRQTDKKSEAEQDDVQILFAQEYWVYINRSFDTHYHFYFKAVFAKLNRDIDALISRGISIHSHPDAIRAFRKEQERLNGEIAIIRDGLLERGDSAKAMQQIENDFRSLKGNMLKFLHVQTIHVKYQNIHP